MLVIALFVAVLVAGCALGRTLVRAGARSPADLSPHESKAIAVSHARASGHLWLFGGVLSALLFIGTSLHASQFPLSVALPVALVELLVASWCALNSVAHYRHAHRAKT